MKAFHSSVQPKKNQFLYSWFVIGLLAFLLGLFVRSTYASFIKKNTAEREQQEFKKHQESLVEKKEILEKKINTLQIERGLEEEFRKRFNVVKEGETMIRIVE